jgi:general secretion pathway protein D
MPKLRLLIFNLRCSLKKIYKRSRINKAYLKLGRSACVHPAFFLAAFPASMGTCFALSSVYLCLHASSALAALPGLSSTITAQVSSPALPLLASNHSTVSPGALPGTPSVSNTATESSPVHQLSAQKNEPVVLNFVNADLDGVIQIIAKLTGRNFLLDPKVKGTISLVSLKPVQPKTVYPLFLAALRQQGLTAVDLPGGITKIVLENDSRSQPVPIIRGKQHVPIGRSHLYTYIQPLIYESPATVIAALRPLMTANSAMSALPNTNTLIVTDYAENIQKLQQIIQFLDTPPGEPASFKLRYAPAGEIASTLNRLLADAQAVPAGASPTESPIRVSIIADTRTNSLLVRSDTLARKVQIQQWIEKLDVATPTSSNLHIIYLKNAEAGRLANVLRNVLGLDNAGVTEPNPQTLPSQPGGGNNNTGTNATPQASTTPRTLSTGGASTGSNINGISVYADTINNAIIVMAPQALYQDIRGIIEQMDIRRAQVFVEALVVEMSADKAAEFGVQWQNFSGLNKNDTISPIGGTNFGSAGGNILGATTLSTSTLASLGQGLNIGVVKGTITLPGIGQIANLGLLARALESKTQANILSTPTLMTLDNEEARIVVGQNVPFITGQYSQNTVGSTATPFQTIERRDVGLTLKVKPQVTEGGLVRLTLYQEVSSVQDQSNTAGIITNKRSIESTVLVDNGQIIVLGGLMQDSLNDSTNQVPIAGNIPILGALFRYRRKDHNKTNLMIFMRPTIVRSAETSQELANDRYQFLMDHAKSPSPLKNPSTPPELESLLPPTPPSSSGALTPPNLSESPASATKIAPLSAAINPPIVSSSSSTSLANPPKASASPDQSN